MLMQSFVPYNYGDYKNLILVQTLVTSYIVVACNLGPDIYAYTFTIVVMEFAIFPIIYSEVWTLGLVVGKVFLTIYCFAILTIFAMLFTYIAHIRGRMVRLIVENVNLLDKMHEGLIVLSQTDLSIRFASIPAIRLLK